MDNCGDAEPMDDLTAPLVVEVRLPYGRQKLHTLLQTRQQLDVERGGHYNGGTAAINVWTHSWETMPKRMESTLKGCFYLLWSDQHIIERIECHNGFEIEDLMDELARLELQAFGAIIHGVMKESN